MNKILIDMVDFQVGGIQRVNATLANYYVSLGCTVHMIAPQIGDPSIYELSPAIELIYYASTDIHSQMKQLFRQLKKEQYDTYLSPLQSKLRLVAVISKVPQIIHILHNTYSYNIREKLAEKLLIKRTTYVAVSEAVRQHTSRQLSVPAKKIHRIYNGIDTSQYHPVERKRDCDTLRICAIGRLVHQKGFDRLIQIMAQAKAKGIKCTATIIGGGELLPNLRELAETLNIQDEIIFLGEQNNIAELLPDYDMLVSTIRYGGFEIVLAEAMACGLPVLAYNVGPTPEVVGDAGALVEENNIDDFVNKLEMFQKNPDLLTTLAQKARTRAVENFDISITLSKYGELLKKK